MRNYEVVTTAATTSRRPQKAAEGLEQAKVQNAVRPRCTPGELLRLQHQYGNRYLQRLLALRQDHGSNETASKAWSQASPLVIQRQRPRNRHQGSTDHCTTRVERATNFRQYVGLLRRAEITLIQCGFQSPNDRIKILSEIYYGTPWSADFAAEASEARSLGFQIYTRRPYSLPRAGPDPRSCLGCGLFLSLRNSQDVGGVDIGHVLIGLNSRVSIVAREETAPFHGAPGSGPTGLEIVTWVGDLGGAAARVALDRVIDPATGVSRYFRGTDYGAASNLEGDVSAYVAASPAGASGAVRPTTLPATGSIADALEAHFVTTGGRRSRCHQFLEMQGARFDGSTLSNRTTVEAAMAVKLEIFGQLYMVNYLRQRNRLDWSRIVRARQQLPRASVDVAHHFVNWLLACSPR